MVALRAKKLSNGKFHLYVDTYKNGKRKKQYLDLYVSQDYTKPIRDANGKLQMDERGLVKVRKVKVEDRDNWELARKLRIEVEATVNRGIYGFDDKAERNTNFTNLFLKYTEEYNSKRKNVSNAAYEAFKKFNESSDMFLNQMDSDYVKRFSNYLTKTYNGETPHAYFEIFKQVVKKAYKEGLIKNNFTEEITVKKMNGEEKDVLSIKELRKLMVTPANNNDVKRAFLFSCLTGLDFNDVKLYFKWSNVKELEKSIMIGGKRGKTGKDYRIPLTDDAVRLLGERKLPNNLVFNLPSNGGTNKSLEVWVKSAGINKHITYHCARHTFGTNLMFYSGDLKGTSKLMTHSKVTETDRYARLAETMKSEILNKMPSLNYTND